MATDSTSSKFDHTSDERFTRDYEEKSASARNRARFARIRDKVLSQLVRKNLPTQNLRVLDIGCNAGMLSALWAEAGHRVTGLDVNEPLLLIARGRAAAAGLSIQFDLGSATQLPYADGTVDVCLMLELLEHVQDWQSCLNEAVRVLAPGGVLYFSTTNALCPSQQEFNLPMYSWYPGPLKRHCERLSLTTKPELANFARYPAVHWFTFYGLRRYLVQRSMVCLDRFDLIETAGRGPWARMSLAALRHSSVVRWMGHVFTPGTAVMAFKPQFGAGPQG